MNLYFHLFTHSYLSFCSFLWKQFIINNNLYNFAYTLSSDYT